MDRSKLLAAAFLAGAFTLGATVGWGFDRTMGSDVTAPLPTAQKSVYEDFAAELQLSPDQKAAVDSILDDRRRVMDSLIAPVRPQMQAARDEAQKAIAARLSPEQQARYQSYLARRAEEQERWRAQQGGKAY
ncbi:hypothetical protein [Roseisolibacter sp. H3M3-2]|uniref:hypothetical protein n=1 Tax=Roseisolibacter sp. H3M3-2 TaxID=3031323 RepID=UPI0023DB11E3|nr:hypothetical protein [Roseisolibacter sp. H3M3-2]MDF1503793.1 hypothetical protein [Roseisolibacter sp. H3M3-2]